MPKRYTKDELKAAVTKWADETGLPAEQRPAFLASLDHDGFAAKLGEAILMRSDYSRAMNDEVAPLKKQYEEKYNELVNQWYPQAKSAHETTAARLRAFEERFGDLDQAAPAGKGKMELETGQIVTKAEFDKLMAAREAAVRTEVTEQTVGVTLAIKKLDVQHWKDFKEPLDVEPLVEIVSAARKRGDQSFSLFDAYQQEYGEKLEAKRTAARKKEVDDAVMAARLDERSKLAAGRGAVVTDEESVGPFFAAQAAAAKRGNAPAPTEEELEAEFIRDLAEAQAQASAAG